MRVTLNWQRTKIANGFRAAFGGQFPAQMKPAEHLQHLYIEELGCV